MPSSRSRDAAGVGARGMRHLEKRYRTCARAGGGNPPIFKRRSENEVIVREGERLVIGGVMTDNDTKTQREVPLLGRIPVLGWLFKSRELTVDSQEMVVIITPTVIPIQQIGRASCRE